MQPGEKSLAMGSSKESTSRIYTYPRSQAEKSLGTRLIKYIRDRRANALHQTGSKSAIHSLIAVGFISALVLFIDSQLRYNS